MSGWKNLVQDGKYAVEILLATLAAFIIAGILLGNLPADDLSIEYNVMVGGGIALIIIGIFLFTTCIYFWDQAWRQDFWIQPREKATIVQKKANTKPTYKPPSEYEVGGRTLEKAIDLKRNGEFEVAAALFQDAFSIYSKLGYKNKALLAKNGLMECYLSNDELDKALIEIDFVIKLSMEVGYVSILGKAYEARGNVYRVKKNNKLAIEAFQDAITAYTRSMESDKVTLIERKLAEIDPSVAQQEDLLAKFKKALQISHHVKITDLASMLGLSRKRLLVYMLEWGDAVHFKIDNDVISFQGEDESAIRKLDEQFSSWGKNEENKDGKT